jgi:hypothetical protein
MNVKVTHQAWDNLFNISRILLVFPLKNARTHVV